MRIKSSRIFARLKKATKFLIELEVLGLNQLYINVK